MWTRALAGRSTGSSVMARGGNADPIPGAVLAFLLFSYPVYFFSSGAEYGVFLVSFLDLSLRPRVHMVSAVLRLSRRSGLCGKVLLALERAG